MSQFPETDEVEIAVLFIAWEMASRQSSRHGLDLDGELELFKKAYTSVVETVELEIEGEKEEEEEESSDE
ncbi:MAG: hypothetical protein GYB68_09360 [Chloroflexi bacterium]|nr:hypothetical protein [Chloroflexota bacterium]